MAICKDSWIVLFLLGVIDLAVFYSSDVPTPIQSSIQNQFSLNHAQFNMFYSIYEIPSLFSCFFCGILIDRLGLKKMFIISMGIFVIGQIVTTSGVHAENFTIILIGRFVLGISWEPLSTLAQMTLNLWFSKEKLAFPNGILTGNLRLCSAINNFISPQLVSEEAGVLPAFKFALILCVIGFTSAYLLNIMKPKNQLYQPKEEGDQSQPLRFSDLKILKKNYYLTLVSGFFVYGSYCSLLYNMNDLMQERFGFDEKTAGKWMGTMFPISAVMAPFLGLAIDKIGRRATLLSFVSLISVLANFVILLLSDTIQEINYGFIGVLFLMLILNSAYSLVFWTIIPMLVDDKVAGIGYGLTSCALNGGFAIITQIFGILHDKTREKNNGYFYSIFFLMIISLIGFIMSVLLINYDKENGFVLEHSQERREEISQNEIEMKEKLIQKDNSAE